MRILIASKYIIIFLIILLFFGCNQLTSTDENTAPAPRPKPQTFPEQEQFCNDVKITPTLTLYETTDCNSQCDPNQKCAFQTSLHWGNAQPRSKSCYYCADVCDAGQYFGDADCGWGCEEGKQCVISRADFGTCYACISSCESSGLSTNENCNNSCGENEYCKKVPHPDAKNDISCYTCKPNEWELPDVLPEKSNDTTVDDNATTARPPDISFIIDGKAKDRFDRGVDKTIQVVLDGGTEKLEYPLQLVLSEKGRGTVFTTYILDTDPNSQGDVDTVGTRVTCTASDTCTVKTDWGAKITSEGRDAEFVVVSQPSPPAFVSGEVVKALSPGASCTLQVKFNPSCKVVPAFTLTNTEGAPSCTVSASPSCKVVLSPGATCTVPIKFNPSCRGLKAADTTVNPTTRPPDVSFIIDGKKSTTLCSGATCTINIDISSTQKLDFPILVKPEGVLKDKTSYLLDTNQATLNKLAKDEDGALKTALCPGSTCTLSVVFKPVLCKSSNTCTVPTDWAKDPVPQTGDAKVDFNFFWNDKDEHKTDQTLLAAGATCTVGIKFRPAGAGESWNCGGWGTCTSGVQTRTCTDANNCGTTTNKPVESQSCQGCIESWSCGEWGSWSDWSSCSESGSQTRTRTKTCTDANSCGTTASKPENAQTESQSCTFTPGPGHQKAEYSSHESSLGSKISNLDPNGASESRDLGSTGGEYGYKISNIPAYTTITSCVTVTAGTGQLGLFYYPQYPQGFDFKDTTAGCTEIYNKNAYANGVLLHLGEPPASVTAQVTVTKK